MIGLKNCPFCGEKALDEFMYNGKSIREWMQIIASEDVISRQAVLNTLTEQERLARDRVIDTPSSLGNGLHMCVNPAYTRYSAQLSERKQFKAMIQSMPSVTPQPKMGRWEYVQYEGYCGNWHCSECRTIIPHMPEETDNTPIYKWCPNCGAKMEANKRWKQEH